VCASTALLIKHFEVEATTRWRASDPANANGEPAKSYPDTLGEKAARALAKRLQAYWHKKGYKAARFGPGRSTNVSAKLRSLSGGVQSREQIAAALS